MTTTVPVQGECAQRFAKLRDAFAGNFEQHGEVGAGVCVYLRGELVVDLWGGYADPDRTRPWERDTIVNVYSTTKGMTAICAHRLVEQGRLDVDQPVAHYWPEFAAAGKQDLPVRYLLSHRAGMAAVREPVTMEQAYDWEHITGLLAAQAPWWEPGTAHGYHAITFGWLVGEVIRRITGQSVGAYFRQEFAGPLGLDFQIGTPAEDDARIADMIPAPVIEGQPTLQDLISQNPGSVAAQAFSNPQAGPDKVNTRGWRAAEIPAANGHSTAPALARIYGALANGGELDGVHVLSPETVTAAMVEQSNDRDLVIQLPTRFGLGFMLTSAFMPLGPNPRAFGHPGAGGSLGYADLDAGIGFGYVMNQMQANLSGDPRVRALLDALYATL